MTEIKLLCFDLDDTLWDVGAVVRRADQEMMLWLGEHYPELTKQIDPAGLGAIRREVYKCRPEIRHDLGAMRLATLELALRQSGHDAATARVGASAAFAVFFRWRNTVEFFPGVIPTLQALARKYPLYALSNGGADIAHMGLSSIFSLHLSAASVGAAKPDPRMYLQALSHAGVQPGQAIHIGDHPQEDIEAAQKTGMKTIWVNWQHKEWPLAQKADAEIKDFLELIALIEQLEQP